jgi:hypothetical protein
MSKIFLRHTLTKKLLTFLTLYLYTFSLYENASLIIFSAEKCLYQVRVITVFTVFRLLTDFVCLYNYEFGLSLCKIVRNSVILLLPLFDDMSYPSQSELLEVLSESSVYKILPTMYFSKSLIVECL